MKIAQVYPAPIGLSKKLFPQDLMLNFTGTERSLQSWSKWAWLLPLLVVGVDLGVIHVVLVEQE